MTASAILCLHQHQLHILRHDRLRHALLTSAPTSYPQTWPPPPYSTYISTNFISSDMTASAILCLRHHQLHIIRHGSLRHALLTSPPTSYPQTWPPPPCSAYITTNLQPARLCIGKESYTLRRRGSLGISIQSEAIVLVNATLKPRGI